jgi:TonB family protein
MTASRIGHGVLLAILFGLGSEAAFSAQTSSATKGAVYAARPKYLREWRAKGIEGEGVVEVTVDKTTGRVTGARMLKSTGHKVLDNSAMEAFRQWRFKPGKTPPKVKIPVEFKIESDKSEASWAYQHGFPQSQAIDANGVRHTGAKWQGDQARMLAPRYPYADRAAGHQGTGVFRLILDLNTGSVKKVSVMKSTGFPSLDEAAVFALLQWRWKPHKWREITIPVTFVMPPVHMPPGAKRLPQR